MKRLIVVLAAVALLLAWWLWPAVRTTRPADPLAATGATAVDARPAAPPASRARAAPKDPAPLPPHLLAPSWLPDVLDELLKRAESGDVAAMQVLGVRLSGCEDDALHHLRQQLRDDEVDVFGMRAQAAASSAGAKGNLQRGQDRMRQMIAECEGVPELLRSSGLDWLAKAAATGYSQAQLNYVRTVLAAFRRLDQDEAVARIEEFRERRILARRYLADAVARCLPGALRLQADGGKALFDNRDRHAYRLNQAAALYAAQREEETQVPAGMRDDPQNLFNYLTRDLDEPARAEARRRGEAQFQACAGH